MNRTTPIALLLALGAMAAVAAEARRPNILWLISEDTGPEALSRSGTPQASTPRLDRLAGEGVYFSHAYFGMVCSVSRSSFMTGMYAASIGAHNHRTKDKKPLPDGVRTLPGWLRDAGYFTALVVKLPDELGFSGNRKTDWNFQTEGKQFDSDAWSDLKPNQPFYAQINFKETHRDYHAPAKADPAKVALPPYYPDHPVARKDWAEYLDAASELDRKISLVLARLEKDGLADDTIVVYFGDNGASMARAKQFCYEEGFHVPLIIRWPKNFPAPKNAQPGTVEARFLDGIDLAPTMLDIAGASKPPKMQGRIFLGEHAEAPREYVFGTRDRCDTTAMRIRSVRDARYRYIRNFTPETPFLAPNAYKERQYPVWNLLKELYAQGKLTPPQAFLCQPRMPDEELYDLQSDPDEIRNLAQSGQPESQAALKRLRGALENWMAEIGDKGRISEAVSPVAVSPAKPNVIFLLTDDQGWSDRSSPADPAYTNACRSFFHMPNNDRISRQSMNFTSGYAPAPVCTPTRRSIQFGMTPARIRGTEFKSEFDPAGHLSLPQMIKKSDPAYVCAHFGKWGEYMIGLSGKFGDPRGEPKNLGYDVSDGYLIGWHHCGYMRGLRRPYLVALSQGDRKTVNFYVNQKHTYREGFITEFEEPIDSMLTPLTLAFSKSEAVHHAFDAPDKRRQESDLNTRK